MTVGALYFGTATVTMAARAGRPQERLQSKGNRAKAVITKQPWK